MANFTPTLSPIHEKSPFRFWCQKVLPTVYDDSLSYYELLTKVVYYLNENTQDLETVNSNVEALYNSYVELQNYVNTYFDENFPQLVQDRLDEMVEDGTFDTLLHAIVDPYFATKSEEIDDTLDQQNDYITWLRNQWNLFINSSAGLPNERTLWSGRMYVEDSEINLDYSYEDYDYLEVYLAIGDTTVPQIFKLDKNDVQNKAGGAWINYPLPAVNVSNAGNLTVITFNIQRVMVEGNDSTDVDYTKLKLTVNANWSWNGQSDSNGALYHYTQGEDPTYNLEMISKIVGIRAVQMDNEVIDARTGYNGTVYQTLGQAIRTQISDIVDTIDEIESDPSPLTGEFELGAQYTDSQEAVVYLTYADIANAVVEGRPVFIKNSTNSLMLQYTETKNNTHYFTGQTVDPETNEIIVHTVTRPARNGIYFKTKITGTRVV